MPGSRKGVQVPFQAHFLPFSYALTLLQCHWLLLGFVYTAKPVGASEYSFSSRICPLPPVHPAHFHSSSRPSLEYHFLLEAFPGVLQIRLGFFFFFFLYVLPQHITHPVLVLVVEAWPAGHVRGIDLSQTTCGQIPVLLMISCVNLGKCYLTSLCFSFLIYKTWNDHSAYHMCVLWGLS